MDSVDWPAVSSGVGAGGGVPTSVPPVPVDDEEAGGAAMAVAGAAVGRVSGEPFIPMRVDGMATAAEEVAAADCEFGVAATAGGGDGVGGGGAAPDAVA
jgi:hypothetical protein